MRNFAKTLAVMGVLTPAGVNALGVGEIRLHSALNQKLLAEIPLLTSSGDDVSQIRVRLAPSQAFAQAGLSRPYFLTNLRFKPIRKSDGSVVIQVTSTDVIREPFLDFLVELDWPQGRMLREFTVLLDPPVTYDDVVKVVQSPPGMAPQPVRTARSVPAKAKTAAISPTVYGPVRPNESLWNIAEKLKPEPAITTEQMVMAIYRENPDAFPGGNVNVMKAGVTLKLPDRDTIMALSPRQARREFQQHYRDWMARRTDVESEHPASDEAKPEAQLKLEAPEEETNVSQGQVETPVIEGPAPIAPETAEALAALQAENRTLKARLETLEKRMAELLELQNATLARLQQASAESGRTEPAVPAETKVRQPAKTKVEPKPSVAAKPTPGGVRPKVTPKPAEEPGLLAGLLDEPVYLSIGGGSLFLLAVAGYLIWRRRQAADEQADSLLVAMDLETDEDAAEAAKPGMEAVSQETEASGAGVEVSESSFLSEFTPSDFDILETDNDAVDPIAEADVYLAYGRYQQAEELIKQALSEQPDDPALRLKLLEIYYANEDAAAYQKYARELQEAAADSDPEFWSKVMEMGRELGLDAAMFAAASSVDSRPSEPRPDGSVLDLDLDSPKEENKAVEAGGEETALFDIDLNPVGSEGAGELPSAEEASPSRKESDDEPDVSFDFEPPELEAKDGNFLEDREETAASEAEEEIRGLDFDLGDIDLPKGKPGTAASTATGGAADGNGLEFSLADEGQAPDSTDEGFDLTDMDELDTKLDLARAYVDMEDVDSAKDILEEVLSQGNEGQKQEAQQLLNKLGLTSS